jgi:hypothetical protein
MKKKPEVQPAAGSRKITTCLYNYVPEQEGELALVRGKLVTVLSSEGNWWRGECQGEVRSSRSAGGKALTAPFCKSGLFPRSFVRNPDEGSQVVAGSRKSLGPGFGGDNEEAAGLREQLAEAQRQIKAADRGALEQALADARRQLAAESQLVAELRKSKASLESIVASSGKGGPATADSTLVEDLRAQLERKRAEIADLTAKKNKYKKHAKAADVKLKELKKKEGAAAAAASSEGSTGAGAGPGEPGEVEELRQAKARLEKKLKAAKQDYDELEKEVHTLEEENSQLEEELGRKRAK